MTLFVFDAENKYLNPTVCTALQIALDYSVY